MLGPFLLLPVMFYQTTLLLKGFWHHFLLRFKTKWNAGMKDWHYMEKHNIAFTERSKFSRDVKELNGRQDFIQFFELLSTDVEKRVQGLKNLKGRFFSTVTDINCCLHLYMHTRTRELYWLLLSVSVRNIPLLSPFVLIMLLSFIIHTIAQ